VYKYYEVILVDPNHKAVSIGIMLVASQLTVIRFDETLVSTGLLSPYTRDGRLVA
jgi:ribosomal protein L15E